MRIISGKYRGKRLHPPRNFNARPTTDFARESLFNILANRYDFEGLEVLDLFAGTGSITYEFASRGASTVVAVELSPVHYRYIRNTCDSMDLEQVTVIRGDAFRYLLNPDQKFDIIFADPPYDHPSLKDLPHLVLSAGLLNEGGLFILEHPGGVSFTAHQRFLEQRKYGSVNFTLFC